MVFRRNSPIATRPQLRRAAFAVVACVAAALLGGCVYRIDIQQGNVIEQDSVEQVAVGMTRSQVQFLLGTPMVADTFHEDRWDYTYYFRRGRERSVEQRWVVVYFEDDRVARIEHEIMPEADEEALSSRSEGENSLPRGS